MNISNFFLSGSSVPSTYIQASLGMRPVGLVFGASKMARGSKASTGLDGGEFVGFSEAFRVAMDSCVKGARSSLAESGGDGVVDGCFELKYDEQTIEIRFSGTAIKDDRSTHAAPFLSTLSSADVFVLREASFEPIDIAIGYCFYGQIPGFRSSNVKALQNAEQPDFTRALTTARNIAYGRLKASAASASAYGIVGIQDLRKDVTLLNMFLRAELVVVGTTISRVHGRPKRSNPLNTSLPLG